MRPVVLGATGAVGLEVVKALLASPAVSRVVTFGRRPLPLPASPKLDHRVVDVFAPETYESFLAGCDAAFCTIGVGQPSKFPPEEFHKVDIRAAADFAVACRRQGVRHFTLLTAVGVNPKSSVRYLRLKGELEETVRALGFERASFFRPSMILTPTNRYGFSQALLLRFWPKLDFLLIGPLRKYRGIKVEDLGRALARNAERPGSGVEALEWDGFREALR